MSNPLFPNGNGLLGALMSRKPRIEIYQDAKEPINKWRWKIWMSSDIIGASSQGYSSKASCIENVKNLGKYISELEKGGKLI